jgi:BON domain
LARARTEQVMAFMGKAPPSPVSCRIVAASLQLAGWKAGKLQTCRHDPVGLRLGLCLGLVGVAFAIGFPGRVSGGKPEARSTDRDWKLTLLARQALQSDRELAPHNLGVSVQDGVATLWGPMPSAPLARRAENRLRNLPDLLEVRNEFHVDPTQAAPTEKPLPREKSAGPARMTGFSREGNSAPAWCPAGRRPEFGRGAAESGGAVADRGGQYTLVLPAITIPTGPGSRGSQASEERGHPSAAPLPAPDLERGLGQLRQRYPQFRAVQTEVRGGLVFVGGAAAQCREVFQFAQLVAELPGVERVVLQSPPPPAPR